MTKLTIACFLLASQCIFVTFANLEGPFLFWGPKELSSYKRPALKSLEQDDLVDIYENQAAIVVFNNQDSLPLTSDNFPRLRKLLERKTMLVLPQDFLDVHPEYINNETQVITVQGPNSERDAEITETFDRLEDIYGEGRVLGVLGSSSSQESVDDSSDSSSLHSDLSPADSKGYVRDRREILIEEVTEPPTEIVYNASGKILFYASDYIVLRYAVGENGTDDEVFKLKTLVMVSADERAEYSRLILAYSTPSGKVTLRIRFPDSVSGYWSIGPVEYEDSRGGDLLLVNKPFDGYLGAPRGFSFRCSKPIVFYNGSVSVTFGEIQVQPQIGATLRFGPANNCIGFTTVPIWSGIAVSFLLALAVGLAIIMITDIKTMDRYQNSYRTEQKKIVLTMAEAEIAINEYIEYFLWN